MLASSKRLTNFLAQLRRCVTFLCPHLLAFFSPSHFLNNGFPVMQTHKFYSLNCDESAESAMGSAEVLCCPTLVVFEVGGKKQKAEGVSVDGMKKLLTETGVL
jgi:hypothetical protein